MPSVWKMNTEFHLRFNQGSQFAANGKLTGIRAITHQQSIICTPKKIAKMNMYLISRLCTPMIYYSLRITPWKLSCLSEQRILMLTYHSRLMSNIKMNISLLLISMADLKLSSKSKTCSLRCTHRTSKLLTSLTQLVF